MLVTVLLVVAGVCALAVIASVIMTRGSNRSALSNMVFGAVAALFVLAGALLIAFLLTRAAFL